jgi:GT2 family glycosyltransferase
MTESGLTAPAGIVDRPPAFPDDVDVAIVSHNGGQTLPRVLDCLRLSGAPDDRVVVYDIGSTDDSVPALRRDRPSVAIRQLLANVGPNPARNWALRDATRRYLLLLDSDAFLHPTAAAHLRRVLSSTTSVAMAAPVVVRAEEPERVQYAGGDLHFLCEAVNPWQDRLLTERGDAERDVGSAPGVALLVDVDIARNVGGWDDRYFMGKDDGDFCYRLRVAGHRLIETPAAVVEHGTRPRSAWLFPYQIRNRWYFLLKNYSAGTLIVLAPALVVHESLQLALLVVKGHFPAWRQAAGDLVSWRSQIGPSRRAVQSTRRNSDGRLLVAAPLLVRSDLLGGGAGRWAKRAYDAWLAAYWTIARIFLR